MRTLLTLNCINYGKASHYHEYTLIVVVMLGFLLGRHILTSEKVYVPRTEAS
jgi:hypothetical protein